MALNVIVRRKETGNVDIHFILSSQEMDANTHGMKNEAIITFSFSFYIYIYIYMCVCVCVCVCSHASVLKQEQ